MGCAFFLSYRDESSAVAEIMANLHDLLYENNWISFVLEYADDYIVKEAFKDYTLTVYEESEESRHGKGSCIEILFNRPLHD